MLKLMKYEFIHSLRTFLIAFAIFLAACLLYPFIMNLKNIANMPVIFMFMTFGFGFLIVGIVIALFVSIVLNYYRSMFKKPGYLTLTLPVSTTQLIVSKMLMSIIWVIIGGIVLILGMSLFIMITGITSESIAVSEVSSIILYFLKSVWRSFMDDPRWYLSQCLQLVSSLCMLVSTIYLTLTFVHTQWVRKHRGLIGIILYFVLVFVIEYIVGMIFGDTVELWQQNIESLVYLCIAFCCLYGTIYFIDHHIEIE